MRVLCTVVSLALVAGLAAAQVTSPTAHLGHEVGADFELADWGQVSGYFKRLATETPRARTEVVGKTTEGREFLVTVIGSEANIGRLDAIKRNAALIADPRGASDDAKRTALEQAVPILMISNAMHSTETAAPQFAMQLAWQLATSEAEPFRSARENMLVVILPCTNPDGLDHVVSWYRETVGTPHEGTQLTRLYQHYAGHDNNRDWFMLTQAETRLVTQLLYEVWHPTVYWDVHQQGLKSERLFVPPFRDPLNPNLDPTIIAGINALGTRAQLDMTREGFSGVATGVSFDMWWNGGNRNVPVRHNIIGLLTEAASVNIASPLFLTSADLRPPGGGAGEYTPSNAFPMPWPGGWWHLRDIMNYELAFARSLMHSLSAEPRTWLANAMHAAEHAIERGTSDAPRAWILPSDARDPGAVRRLVDTLLASGIEIERCTRAPVADDRTYPPGSLVIRRNQPYGAHVKDLFEVQHYPDGPPPYDIAGWTLPYLLGVHRVEVMRTLEVVSSVRVRSASDAMTSFTSRATADVLPACESDSWPALFQRLAQGQHARWLDSGNGAGLIAFHAHDGEPGVDLVRLPRVGIYAPWTGSMDEGWLRYVADTFQLPYVTVRNEMLRASRLDRLLDVLVMPDIAAAQLDRGRPRGTVADEYAGGLDPEGAIAIEEFVRGGGTLVTIANASQWAIDLFDLPLVDVTRGKTEFSCPGSVLRAIPEVHRLSAGLTDSIALFFAGGAAWRRATKEERKDRPDDARTIDVLLRYAPTRTLLSGWIKAPEVIAGQAAWVRAQHGKGAIHLFGFSPHFRGWSQACFPLLFRALLDAAH